MKRYFTVVPKHWWLWFTPKYWRERIILQAFLDEHQEEFAKEYSKQLNNMLLYGHSIPPDEFYGQSIIDKLLCKHKSTDFDPVRMADICVDCGQIVYQ